MCTRVQRLLLLLGAVAALAVARPAEVGPTEARTAAAEQPLEAPAEEDAPTDAGRSKRGILFSTHGYPGLVYPQLGYPYPGYFDLRYPGVTYPSYPTLTGYPGYPGYPFLVG